MIEITIKKRVVDCATPYEILSVGFDLKFLKACGFKNKDALAVELTSDGCLVFSYLGQQQYISRSKPIARIHGNQYSLLYKRIPEIVKYSLPEEREAIEGQVIDGKLVVDISKYNIDKPKKAGFIAPTPLPAPAVLAGFKDMEAVA